MRDALITQMGDRVYANEQSTLAEGLIRGFYRYVWPRILSIYPEIIVIEQEVLHQDFMVKPDLVVATQEGTLVYIEYKTTSSKNDKWMDSWELNPQIHAYLQTINKALDLEVRAAIVHGLYKGYESYGKQNSPFCYAYARPANPPFFEGDLAYEYKAGFKKTPVWDLPGGIKSWVENMPEAVLLEQFPITKPIYLNDPLADAFFRQAKVREQEIALSMQILEKTTDPEVKQAIMDASFPQNFEACAPSFGFHCPFKRVCHPEVEGLTPYDLGFTPRIPHHSSEVEFFKSRDAALTK